MKSSTIPKVPVYTYTYSEPPTQVIRLYDYTEELEEYDATAYYTLCCVIRENTVYLNRYLQALLDDLTPSRYIATPLVAKMIHETKKDIEYCSKHINRDYATWVSKAEMIAKQYHDEFEQYVAAIRIQKFYLSIYYNPESRFCQTRLDHVIKEFNRMLK